MWYNEIFGVLPAYDIVKLEVRNTTKIQDFEFLKKSNNAKLFVDLSISIFEVHANLE